LPVPAAPVRPPSASWRSSGHSWRRPPRAPPRHRDESTGGLTRRALVALRAGSTPAQKASAKARAEKLRKSLQSGASLAKVAAQGDGPEKAHGGELGLFARGDLNDLALERAAFALQKPGEVSAVAEGRDGFSVLVLLERRPKLLPPFDELRPRIRDRLAPIRKRKAFDDLRAQLRKQGNVKIDEVAFQ